MQESAAAQEGIPMHHVLPGNSQLRYWPGSAEDQGTEGGAAAGSFTPGPAAAATEASAATGVPYHRFQPGSGVFNQPYLPSSSGHGGAVGTGAEGLAATSPGSATTLGSRSIYVHPQRPVQPEPNPSAFAAATPGSAPAAASIPEGAAASPESSAGAPYHYRPAFAAVTSQTLDSGAGSPVSSVYLEKPDSGYSGGAASPISNPRCCPHTGKLRENL